MTQRLQIIDIFFIRRK